MAAEGAVRGKEVVDVTKTESALPKLFATALEQESAIRSDENSSNYRRKDNGPTVANKFPHASPEIDHSIS